MEAVLQYSSPLMGVVSSFEVLVPLRFRYTPQQQKCGNKECSHDTYMIVWEYFEATSPSERMLL